MLTSSRLKRRDPLFKSEVDSSITLGMTNKKAHMRKHIGEMLVEERALSRENLQKALSFQKAGKARIGRVLTDFGFVSEKSLVDALALQLRVPSVDLQAVEADREALNMVPEEYAERKKIFPVRLVARRLMLAMADPLDYQTIEEMKFRTGCEILPAIASEKNILDCIEKHYQVKEKVFHLMNSIKSYKDAEFLRDRSEEKVVNVQSLYKLSETPPIIQLVTMIIVEAVKMRASDIHIEPREESVAVRYRVDGDLREALIIPRRIKDYVISRIKIIADMDITNRRLPQDGTSKLKLSDREVDLRISTLPSLYGEKVVIRLLDKSKGLISLDQIGFPAGIKEPLLNALSRPQGFLLITGPTGSGKSTTLYAILRQVRSEKENVVTIEDPVEYRLSGVTQVGINEAMGLTFPNVLRSILRQDPDIIMVGEIRDRETADIAVKSSLTGHLVLSTLHTNSTVSSITRLIDIGIPAYLAGSSLTGVLAQRLVRRICPHCKREEEQNDAAYGLPEIKKSFSGAGCNKCYGTGYYGQVGIFEYLALDRNLRNLIAQKASEEEIWKAAREKGMRTLFEDAVDKVNAGITTAGEIIAKVPMGDI